MKNLFIYAFLSVTVAGKIRIPDSLTGNGGGGGDENLEGSVNKRCPIPFCRFLMGIHYAGDVDRK